MSDKALHKARTLVEALPYINKFQGDTIVIKYGGSLMFQPEAMTRFCEDVVLLRYVGMNPIIVHGGGKEISHWLERAGKQTVFIDGLRVTDFETMEITEMVLSGKVRNAIVSHLNRCGGKAVGLSGKDADLFNAQIVKSRDNRDLGLVGEVKDVDATLLDVLAGNGYIPVISSVGISKEGDTLNINADEAAGAVAIAVKAAKLIYLSDIDGIMKDGSLLSFLELKDAEALLNDPAISGGMIPKLNSSIKAIKRGVQSVHIINGSNEHAVLLEVFTDTGVGTMLAHRKTRG